MKKLKTHILVLSVLGFFLGVLIVVKSQNVFTALTWGSDDFVCKYNRESDMCRPQKTVTVPFGIYDYEDLFLGDRKNMNLLHNFIDWRKMDGEEWTKTLARADSEKKWILLTLEPWTDKPRTLLSGIVQGVYDTNIDTSCAAISQSQNPVFLRFGHEMEQVTGRYPWAVSDSEQYVESYKYFIDRCRLQTNNFYTVWSPAGNPGLEKYWVGPEYADYIGLSVYAYQAYELKNYGIAYTFREQFGDKYNRVKSYNRPIMIAEMGVTGDNKYVRTWMNTMYKSLPEYPLLKDVVYFYAKDTEGVWGDFPTPDWKIDQELLTF